MNHLTTRRVWIGLLLLRLHVIPPFYGLSHICVIKLHTELQISIISTNDAHQHYRHFFNLCNIMMRCIDGSFGLDDQPEIWAIRFIKTSHLCNVVSLYMFRPDFKKDIILCKHVVFHILTHDSHLLSSSLCFQPPDFPSIHVFKILGWSSFPLFYTMTMKQQYLHTANFEVRFSLNLICFGTKITVSFPP